ncbi:cytochrome b, partial [Aeromonas salmonicida]
SACQKAPSVTVTWGWGNHDLLADLGNNAGLCYSGAAGRGVALFGWFIIPMNPDINDPANVIPYSESIRDIAHTVHVYLPYIMLAMLLAHIVGALKHHLLDKDLTLLRMLGRK